MQHVVHYTQVAHDCCNNSHCHKQDFENLKKKKPLRMITNFSELPSIYFPQLGLTL